jgi:hypothetical protein
VTHSAGLTGVIAAAFLLLHLPFLPPSLEDLDSINFALGVRHFDVTQHQPHPPGYPVYVLAAKGLRRFTSSEVQALGLLSVICGALSVLALGAMYRRLDRDPRSEQWSMLATALAVTAPLYWFTAARPLSDMSGLAAALGVQAFTLSAGSGGALALAALLAGLAAGIRSQVIWLTVPLLVLMAVRRPARYRVEDALVALGAFVLGGLVWFVPLVWVTGGPLAYFRTLSTQGSEDFSGVAMLWTSHGPRQLLLAFNSTFLGPWGTPILAGVVLTLAAAGAARLFWGARSTVGLLLVAFGPYLLFDLLFQETATTRYALPVVVPLAYLAVRGAALAAGRLQPVLVGALIAASLAIVVPNLHAYSRFEAPAFRMLKDMRDLNPTLGAPPVFAAHRRGHVDLRRPIVWRAEEMPAFSQRMTARPKHEWLELVEYWNLGGRAPVWFVADPLRSDLALIDRPLPPRPYRWPLALPVLLGGVRPNEMDWYRIDQPVWYLGEGWALTPETGGVATEDRRTPADGPIQGWIQRHAEPLTLIIGGRNLTSGESVAVEVSLDGRPLTALNVPPGFFLHMMRVEPAVLAGSGDYATLTVAAKGHVAIEQFNAQPPGRVVFGYAEGWNELEYSPETGKLWRWMTGRGALRVRGTGQTLVLTMAGVTETFSKSSMVSIRAGDRVLTQQEVGETFSIRAEVPAAAFDQDGRGEQVITIETDQTFVPAEKSSGSADRRQLGLKVFDLQIASGTR